MHFIYPKLCLNCAKTLMAQEELLCLECIELLPFTQYHDIVNNQSAQRFDGRIKYENITSSLYFTKDGLLQFLLHEFKYKGSKNVGLFLGNRFGQSLKKTNWIKDIDVIIPVPLHSNKYKSRGYNQSEIIAMSMGAILNVETNTTAFIRVRNTDSQTHKSRIERSENMDGAFALADKDSLVNKHILLLDDVLTTGATLEACYQTLKDVEGIKISIATIAIATA